MSHAIRFDTLAYANKLKDAGIPAKQAEAQSEALAEVLDYQITTKKDLQETETKLITQFDVKLAELKNDLVKWMVSLVFLQSGLLIAAINFLH